MMIKLAFIISIVITLSACTTLTKTDSVYVISDAVRQESCLPALVSLDAQAMQSSGTVIANRIPGLPWLRHNRLITHDIATQKNTKHLDTLLRRMSVLAKQGLQYELATVSKVAKRQWQKQYRIRQPVHLFVATCSERLIALQVLSPTETFSRLKSIVPDNDYSTLARWVGLYPLATIPFRLGVVNEQRQLAKEWGQVEGKRWFAYKPNLSSSTGLASSSWGLLNQHAPIWHVGSRSSANLPGAPYWQGDSLKVNTKKPEVYSFISEARWKQQPVTQLNYVIWFSERPRLKPLDWVAGQHDAVVFRVNLNQQGEAIAYDSIHLCGCWYRLFVPEGSAFKNSKSYWKEPISIHRVSLPTRSSPRMAIFLQSDTHQIQFLQPAYELANQHSRVMKTAVHDYQLQPFSQLLKLPTMSGVRPVFGRQGYIAGSERPERWLFWPMGVKNPGALRRFGDHAISFIGRRYFDDPNLLSHFAFTPSDD